MIETITELARAARACQWLEARRPARRASCRPWATCTPAITRWCCWRAQHADRVVASVFVNPTQFGPNEDFTRYPRTPEADTTGLRRRRLRRAVVADGRIDVSVRRRAGRAACNVPGVTDVLEGAHRPGHFDGVCTVVARLFNQVQPDVAVFGKKDYQQLAVIRQMVTDLAFPIEILGGSIVRESDGLAMSSRNQYLAAEERPAAAEIRRALLAMRDGDRRRRSRVARSRPTRRAGWRKPGSRSTTPWSGVRTWASRPTAKQARKSRCRGASWAGPG